MKSVVSFLIIFLAQIVFSQTEGGRTQYAYINNSFLSAGNGSMALKTPTKGDAQGSMYYYEQFSALKVGGVLQDFLVRYNAYEDRMELQDGDKLYEYFPNIHDKEFQIINLGKTYIYLNYFLDEIRSENGYLVVLQRGERYTLYEKERIKLQEGRVSQTGYDKTVPDKYVPVKDEFYIGFNGDKIIKLPKSKKDFSKLFGDKEDKVSDIIKSGKYSLKDKTSLKGLLMQLNTKL